jgi:purine-binding chemotaxis protein CheW
LPQPEAIPAAATASPVRRFLTFRSAGNLYALPAGDVSEVIRFPAVARIPQSPLPLLGLANLRGAVVPLVGLRQLLGLAGTSGEAATARAIVLDHENPLALAVESVDSLVAIGQEQIEVRESELGAESGERLTGSFQSAAHSQVAKILDIKSLLTAAFSQLTRPRRQPRAHVGDAEAAAQPSAPAERATMLVTFDVAEQEFALDLEVVEEILPAPAVLMRVPRADAIVLGVTSVRDRLLPLLSLRALLGFPPAPDANSREKVVVTRVGGARVGLVADRARAILQAQASSIDPVPALLAARTGGETRLRGIYRGKEGRRLVSILMPEQLFREDVMRRLSREEREGDTMREAQAPRGEAQFLVFRLGDDEFGLPIDSVDEVGAVPANITRLPKTPKFLEGVVNLRGDVIPVVDQRRRFELPSVAESGGRRLVVVRTAGVRAGLIVDSVSDVLRVAASAVEPPPNLTERIASLVRGVINLERSQRMVLVLDPAELLTPSERGRLDTFNKASRADV